MTDVHIVVVDNGDTEPELWAFADATVAERFAKDRGNNAEVNTLGIIGTLPAGEPEDVLGPPPDDLADAWERYQHGGDVEGWELTKLDEWRAERAEGAGY